MVVVRLSAVCPHSAAPRQNSDLPPNSNWESGRRCPPVEGIPKSKLNLRGSIFPGAALPRATKLALNEMTHSSPALFERKKIADWFGGCSWMEMSRAAEHGMSATG